MGERSVICVYGKHVARGPPQKMIVLEEEIDLQRTAWDLLFHDLHLQIGENVGAEGEQEAERLFEELKFWQRGAEALVSDVRDLGGQIVANFMANLPYLEGALKASAFSLKYAGVPAIICGSGPSLKRHLPLLKFLEKRVLLFAGGSSLKILAENGITPHMGAALDPYAGKQIFPAEGIDTPFFFFPLRVSKEVLPLVRGKKVWVADGASYPLERWLTGELGIEEARIDGGWNVATLCIHLASMMGCDPIILVGVDLALSLESVGLQQGEVVTKNDFLLAADWIEDFIKEHPSLNIYTVSKECLDIPSILYRSLENFTFPEREIPKCFSSEDMVFSASLKSVIDRWQESVVRVAGLVEELLLIFERAYPLDPRSQGSYSLKEVEMAEEPFYRFLVEPIWDVFRFVLVHEEVHTPFPGFKETIQKLVFIQKLAREITRATL